MSKSDSKASLILLALCLILGFLLYQTSVGGRTIIITKAFNYLDSNIQLGSFD